MNCNVYFSSVTAFVVLIVVGIFVTWKYFSLSQKFNESEENLRATSLELNDFKSRFEATEKAKKDLRF